MRHWIIPTILLTGIIGVVVYLPYAKEPQEDLTVGAIEDIGIPPAGIIVDMPDGTKAGSLHSRLDLLVGGGDREIVAVVTKRTHANNRAVLENYPSVKRIVNLTTSPSDATLRSRILTELGTTSDLFIEAWPK